MGTKMARYSTLKRWAAGLAFIGTIIGYSSPAEGQVCRLDCTGKVSAVGLERIVTGAPLDEGQRKVLQLLQGQDALLLTQALGCECALFGEPYLPSRKLKELLDHDLNTAGYLLKHPKLKLTEDDPLEENWEFLRSRGLLYTLTKSSLESAAESLRKMKEREASPLFILNNGVKRRFDTPVCAFTGGCLDTPEGNNSFENPNDPYSLDPAFYPNYVPLYRTNPVPRLGR